MALDPHTLDRLPPLAPEDRWPRGVYTDAALFRRTHAQRLATVSRKVPRRVPGATMDGVRYLVPLPWQP